MKQTIRSVIASSLLAGLAVSGWAQGSDNFDDNSRNTTNWGSGSYGTGTLTEISQRLAFSAPSGDHYAAWQWSGSPTFGTSWSAQVDVNVPTFSIGDTQSYSAGFYIEGGAGAPNSNYSVSATLAPHAPGGIFDREYDSELNTGGISSAHVFPNTSSTSAALMVDFNATTKVLSTYYDDDGASGGYSWTQLVSVDIGVGGVNWGMSNSDVFSLQIFGSSKNFAIATGDGLALDNFSTSVSAIPEPSTYAAIFGAVALAGVAIHRRRRVA